MNSMVTLFYSFLILCILMLHPSFLCHTVRCVCVCVCTQQHSATHSCNRVTWSLQQKVSGPDGDVISRRRADIRSPAFTPGCRKRPGILPRRTNPKLFILRHHSCSEKPIWAANEKLVLRLKLSQNPNHFCRFPESTSTSSDLLPKPEDLLFTHLFILLV